jgi:hypothetical protein
MKFEQLQLINNLIYSKKLLEHPDIYIPDELLEAFLKRTDTIKKKLEKHVNTFTAKNNSFHSSTEEKTELINNLANLINVLEIHNHIPTDTLEKCINQSDYIKKNIDKFIKAINKIAKEIAPLR